MNRPARILLASFLAFVCTLLCACTAPSSSPATDGGPHFRYTPPPTAIAPIQFDAGANSLAIAAATDAGAGSMAASDKAKLDTYPASPGSIGGAWDPVTFTTGGTVFYNGAASYTIGTQFYADGSVARTITALKAWCANPSNTTITLQLWTATGTGTATEYETHDVVSNGSAERLVTVALSVPLVMAKRQIYIVSAYDQAASSTTWFTVTNYVNATPNWSVSASGQSQPAIAGGIWLFGQFFRSGVSHVTPPNSWASGGFLYPVSVTVL